MLLSNSHGKVILSPKGCDHMLRTTDLESCCSMAMEPRVTRGWYQAREGKIRLGIVVDGKSQGVQDLGTNYKG